jgi:CubicO group peptidase (beta-lactamase class C family)
VRVFLPSSKSLAERAPSPQVAVARHGTLLRPRAFGTLAAGGAAALTPDTCFMIASVSKPIAALAIAKLVEQGRRRRGPRRHYASLVHIERESH